MQDCQNQENELDLLRKENEFYKNLLAFSSVAIIVSTNSSSLNEIHILDISAEFTKLTGYTMSDINTGFDGIYTSLIDERDCQNYVESVSAQLEKSNSYEVEYRIKTRNGGLIWVKETGKIGKDNNKTKDSILADITAFKQHEEKLEQSEQLFRITNKSSGGAVFDLDLKTGQYIHFENAERIYGVPAEKIISDTKWFGTLSPEKALNSMIDYFYHPDDYDIVAAAFKRLPIDKEIHYIARSKRADGLFLWTQVHISLMFDDSGVAIR